MGVGDGTRCRTQNVMACRRNRQSVQPATIVLQYISVTKRVNVLGSRKPHGWNHSPWSTLALSGAQNQPVPKSSKSEITVAPKAHTSQHGTSAVHTFSHTGRRGLQGASTSCCLASPTISKNQCILSFARPCGAKWSGTPLRLECQYRVFWPPKSMTFSNLLGILANRLASTLLGTASHSSITAALKESKSRHPRASTFACT